MTVRKTKQTLAKTVNAQINPNLAKREDWKNCDKALADGDKTYASSTFTKTKYIKSYKSDTKKDKNGKAVTTKTPVYDTKHNHPYVLSAHEFGFSIPSNAYIVDIKFYVRMKATGVSSVESPMCRFDVYGNAFANKKDENKAVNTTGWDDGLYYHKRNDKISSSWKTYTYSMSEAETKKAKVRAKHINADVFGIDLLWYNAIFKGDLEAYKNNKNDTGHIYVAWVKCVVEYEIPEYSITYSVPSTKSNPIDVPSGQNLYITATYKQSTRGYGGTQELDLTLPWGTELVGTQKASTGSSFNASTMKWTVPANGKHTNTLDFRIKSYVRGINNLSIGNSTVGDFPCYYQTSVGLSDGYDDLILSLDGEVHKNHRACAYVSIDGYSDDTSATYYVHQPTGITSIEWAFINGSDGVGFDSASGNNITLTVPANERFQAYLRVCFVPTATGNKSLTVKSDDTGHNKTITFDVLDPYTYHITSKATDSENSMTLSTAVFGFSNHRVASEIETQAVVLPFYVDEFDSYMTQSKSTLTLEKWEQLDYIGCIPLEQLHFDPKSTYKDKLLDTHYKNKRYMGKQLASDEDISLNIRLHPQQVTTLQGLIDMDKPIPINTNHRIWEGDSLNHRGWAEIYGLKVEQTGNNPHWYKCEVDVKYLTHNLHTRFHIQRGSEKVNTQPINDLMSQVFEIGDSLSDTDFFITTTDGTYMYNEDEEIVVDYLDSNDEEVIWDGDQDIIDDFEENGYIVVNPTINQPIQVLETIDVPADQRNVFSIDNGQNIDIISKDSLGNVSEVVFDWSSTVLDEYRENNVERIVELLDENNEPVFKYQYNELEFEYDYTDSTPVLESISANPIIYVKKDGAWMDDTEEVTLRIDVESGMDSDITYGSRLHFQLDNHKLRVIDEGFNGREWEIPNITLEGQSYKWHTRWVNKNDDGESNDVMAFLGLSVSNTVFDSQFADKYGKLVVSPFPVADRKLLFTREAEEGTIYYYEDDENAEFSYMIEPYYMYHNGCDLQSDTGISIFNLNYGYEIVYIQNGLVRLGFDRLSEKGRLFLGRYDPTSDSYVTTNVFRFDKYADINLKSITDDKIEIQASDTIFTIYRGHPYIVVNHSDEDIWIDTRFTKVWAEKVGAGDFTEYPTYWDLMNNANILPSCVGGIKEIKTSCIEVDTRDNPDKASTTLEWATGTTFDDIVVDTEKTFYLTSSNISESQEISLDGGHSIFGDYKVIIGHDETVPYHNILIGDSPIQNGETGTLKAKIAGYDYNPLAGKSVDFIQKSKQLWSDTGSNNILLRMSTTTSGSNRTITATGDYAHFFLSANARIYSLPLIVEFDISVRTISSGGGCAFDLYDGTNEKRIWLNSTGHYKIQIDENGVATALDGSQSITQSGGNVSGICRASMYAHMSNDSITFSNLTVTGDVKVYPITDKLFDYDGRSSVTDTDKFLAQSGATVTKESDGTVFATTGSGTGFIWSHLKGTPESTLDGDYTGALQVDLDVISTSHSENGVLLYESYSSSAQSVHIRLKVGHNKIIRVENKIWHYVDDVLQSYTEKSLTEPLRIGIRIQGSSNTLKAKNIRIYQSAEDTTTDANGIATCRLIGDGSGLETYSAKCENIESEPIEVIDGIFYDRASISNNRNWDTVSANMNLTRNTDYTTLKRIVNPTTFGWLGLQLPLTDHFAVEFDAQMTATNNESLITFRVTGGTVRLAISKNWAWSDGNWHHTKLEINGTTVKATVDGVAKSDLTLSGDITVLQFEARNDSIFNFKNFVIYPIESEEEPTPVEPVPTTLTLSNTKDILSAYDEESTTLTATVLDESGNAMEGESVVFKKGSTTLDTKTTNSSGVATYDYSADGSGDVTITVTCESLTQSKTIEDCLYWNDGSSVGSLEFASNVSCTSNGEYITITTNTSGEKDVKLPVTLSGDWEFETTLAELGTTNDLTFKVGTGSQWGAVNHDSNQVGINFGGTTTNYSKTIQANDVLKITYITGTMSAYWNDDFLKSSTVSVSGKMGYYTNNGRVQKIKNIKLKAL